MNWQTNINKPTSPGMKNKNILIAVVSFLLFITGSYAQSPGEWSKPLTHPCFQGIMISVVNMGKGSGDNDYLWGIKFKNNYDVPVTFKYKLSIGEKITSKYGGNEAPLKRKGDQNDTRIDGNDKFTAKLYHNSSEEWYLYVWDVCFDGMRCGGADECFADCDKDKDYPKPNQPCGLSSSPSLNAPEINNEPKEMSGKQAAGPKKEGDETPDIGETSNWVRDDKKVEVNMGKTEKGIYWKRKNNKKYTFFEKLPSGAYRYEVGKDTYIIQFVSATKIQFSENGTVTNHYNLVTDEEDDGDSKVRSGIWTNGGDKFKITVKEDGLTYDRINDECTNCSKFFKKISATEYRRYDPDGILFCTLKLKEDKKLHYTCNDKPDSYVGMGELTFISADEETKPAAETNGDDKYNFKGTTIWKDEIENTYTYSLYAIIDSGLYDVKEGGNPSDIPWNWSSVEVKKYALYHKTTPDVYEWKVNHSKSSYYIVFLSNDKLMTKGYDNNGKKLRSKYFANRIETWSENSLPKASNETISLKDATGKWDYEVKYNTRMQGTSIQLASNSDNKITIKDCNSCQEFLYEKVSANVYEYKVKNVGAAKLVFVSPTRICLSYVYKNYVSIGYYNKPAAPPIVKQENKPVSPSDISADWRTEDGSITLTLLVKDNGLYAKIKGSSDETALLYKKISATEYRKDYSADTYEIVRVINNDKIETLLYGPDATYPNGKSTQFLYRVKK